MADELIFTGSGDALGVPRVYCDCPVCTEARTTGQNHRRRCSALVRAKAGTFWLDCGPDWHLRPLSLAAAGPGVLPVSLWRLGVGL